MPYKTVVFDLDGTLLDTLEDLALSVNAALAAHAMPTRTIDEVRAFVGNGVRLLVHRAVPEGTSPSLESAVFGFFSTHYAHHKEDHTAPYPGIPEALAALRDAGVRLAVASNKADSAVQPLVERYFPATFDAVIGEQEQAGIPKKPDPAMVRALLGRMGVTREGLAYVGDSDVDIQTARNCAADAVICSWGYRDRDWLAGQGARVIVDTPQELVGVLLGGRRSPNCS